MAENDRFWFFLFLHRHESLTITIRCVMFQMWVFHRYNTVRPIMNQFFRYRSDGLDTRRRGSGKATAHSTRDGCGQSRSPSSTRPAAFCGVKYTFNVSVFAARYNCKPFLKSPYFPHKCKRVQCAAMTTCTVADEDEPIHSRFCCFSGILGGDNIRQNNTSVLMDDINHRLRIAK